MKRAVFVCVALASCGGSAKKAPADLSATSPDLAMMIADAGPDVPGPGKSLACETSGKNAFETYGATTLVAINEAIFANAGTEVATNGSTNLGPSFMAIGTGTPAATADPSNVFKAKLGAFLVWAYGGPSHFQYSDGNTYAGVQDMVAAHTGLGITQAQYDYFVSNIVVPALASSGVANGSGDSPNDVATCFAPVLTDPTFAASIVGH